MKDPRPQAIRREDYKPPEYWIDAVDLEFELGEQVTVVTAKLQVRRDASAPDDAALRLHGERLELQRVAVDGVEREAGDYVVEEEALIIGSLPGAFELTTTVAIKPQDNTELSGLYRSGEMFCTQCEAEGFRRITYFLDRPDVMAKYSTTIVAEKKRYPVLLSNGNRVDEGDRDDGRHFVRWVDPYPKPSYLFALVAADLRCHAGSFTTKSGRDVRLEIWVEPDNIDACEHALRSLQKSMKWDEETYGLEYDLDIYMIVAVSDFNMAAMENKGLNIFNAKFVLARPETATDDDYENIEGVIAHEYFHNWTGNRVTCRDWFQLTLKEGLTVFRDEQFTADMTSAPVKRIIDVRTLRTAQFAEDASPTAHPIRPDSYIEMNNFYTVTVYNKGAEVVRMYHTLLGAQGFRKGMDLYFERHDGEAVTCDDFRAAMADANGADLEQFGRWYSQAGTPIVSASTRFDADRGELEVTLEQRAPAGATGFEPMHIPVAIGLVGRDGNDVAPNIAQGDAEVRGTTALVQLREPKTSVRFQGVAENPILSLPRNFSAPIRIELERSDEDLAFLMGHDSDAFSRWDAAQVLAESLLLRRCGEQPVPSLPDAFVDAWGRILLDPNLDGSLKALTLSLPDERVLGQAQDVVDVDGLHAVREHARRQLGAAHRDALRRTYNELNRTGAYSIEQSAVDGRRLKNLALAYLLAAEDPEAIELAQAQLNEADNMTDAQAALSCLADLEHEAAGLALESFRAKWKHRPLVLDKWFSVQAASKRADTLDRVVALSQQPDFTLKNPNRARALIGVFAVRNQCRFHQADGAGYAFLADKILELDELNPQVAARLVGAFNRWRSFDAGRQTHMGDQLRRILAKKGLSKDVYELASKSLAAEAKA